MGNCGFKGKKKAAVRNPQERSRIGTLRINKSINCPKCGMIFSPGTAFLIVNSHIETCLLTDESALNGSNFVVHENQVAPSDLIAANGGHRHGHTKYIWIKKVDENNKVSWEKTVSKSTKTVDHLENMTIQSAKELTFEDKKKWFKLQMDKIRIPWVCGADFLTISQKNIIDTALKGVHKIHWHKEVKIVFEEEKNVNDAGGLLREFIYLVCQELFKAERGLFITTETEEVIYTINPKAEDSQKNLELYNFLGKVIGKALFEQMSIPVQLDRFLLKQLLGTEFNLDDLAVFDKQLYNSLNFMKQTPIDDEEIFEEFFVVRSPVDGQEIELMPNGKETKINDSNKEKYVKLMLEWIGKKSVEKKQNAFFRGLLKVVPEEIFEPLLIEELEMILYGLPFIDVNDWEHNTVYKGAFYKNHQIVKWFWEVIKELNQEELAKFFCFCTGSTRPPVEGFSALQSNRGEIQKFTVESVKHGEEKEGLKAHTCFNRLELPMYSTKEQIQDAVRVVLNIDFRGVFGLE